MSDRSAQPIPGLPEALPVGERLLWQGSPHWPTLARRAFHTRKVAIYGTALLAWHLVAALADGKPLLDAALSTLLLVPVAFGAVVILGLMAWLYAWTTVYTITSRRVVIRSGVAMQGTLNLPFRAIASADLRTYHNRTGDLPLSLLPDEKVAYLALWPHARPWRFSRPVPMLRAVPDVVRVAAILADALGSATSETPPAAAPSYQVAAAA